MAKKPKAAPADKVRPERADRPQRGGRYVRQPDGTLKRDEPEKDTGDGAIS